MMINKIIKLVFLKMMKIISNDFEFLPSTEWSQKELLS